MEQPNIKEDDPILPTHFNELENASFDTELAREFDRIAVRDEAEDDHKSLFSSGTVIPTPVGDKNSRGGKRSPFRLNKSLTKEEMDFNDENAMRSVNVYEVAVEESPCVRTDEALSERYFGPVHSNLSSQVPSDTNKLGSTASVPLASTDSLESTVDLTVSEDGRKQGTEIPLKSTEVILSTNEDLLRTENASSGRISEESTGSDGHVHVDEYASRLLAYEKRIRTLEEERAELMAKSMRLEANEETKDRERCKKCESVAVSHLGEVKSLHAQIQEAQRDKQVLQAELEAQKESLRLKRSEVEELHTELAEMELRIKDDITPLAQIAVERTYDEAHQALAEDLKEANEMLEQKTKALTGLHQANAALRDELVVRERADEAAGIEKIHLKEQLDKYLVQVQELTAAKHEDEEKIQKLDSMLSHNGTVSKELEQLQRDLRKSKEDHHASKRRAQEAEEEANRWRIQADERGHHVNSLMRQLKEASESAHELEVPKEYTIPQSRSKSSLVEELSKQVEELVHGREQLQQLLETLHADIASKDKLIAKQRDLNARELKEIEFAYKQQVQQYKDEVERLKRESTDGRVDPDLSIQSFCELDASSVDLSLERALSTAEGLLQSNRELASKLSSQSSEVDSGRELYEQLAELIVAQDKAIQALQESVDKQPSKEALDAMQSQIERLQEIAQHESSSNSELRVLLNDSEAKTQQQKEIAAAQCKRLEGEIYELRSESADVQSWMKSLWNLINLSVASEKDVDSSMPRIQIENAIHSLVLELENEKRLAGRAGSLERCAASLKVQKNLLLHVYASRGENAPGVRWRDEKVRGVLPRLRCAVTAIIATARFSNLSGETSPVVVDSSQFFDLPMHPPVWKIKNSGALSPGSAVIALEAVKKTLADRERRLSVFEENFKRTYTLGSSVVEDRSENRRMNELLEKEMELSSSKNIELISKWKRATAEAEEAKTQAKEERNARKCVESKLRNYSKRLEQYSEDITRLRSENRRRGETVKRVVRKLEEKFTVVEPVPDVATHPTKEVQEKKDEDTSVFRNLEDRRKRANKMLASLAQSAKKDLDSARSHGGEEGGTLAKQIEDYIAGLKTTSRKLDHVAYRNESQPRASKRSEPTWNILD